MTADEMFRQIGYERGTMFGDICYRNVEKRKDIAIGKQILSDEKYITAFADFQNPCGFTGKEVLAVAQWIKEQEENHG